MNPYIFQSIAAQYARELEDAAFHNRDPRLARDHRLRQRRAPRTLNIWRLLPARLRLRTS
jgi:hypothetical protein